MSFVLLLWAIPPDKLPRCLKDFISLQICIFELKDFVTFVCPGSKRYGELLNCRELLVLQKLAANQNYILSVFKVVQHVFIHSCVFLCTFSFIPVYIQLRSLKFDLKKLQSTYFVQYISRYFSYAIKTFFYQSRIDTLIFTLYCETATALSPWV